VDTGAQFTVVDPLLATELHLKTQGSAEVVSVVSVRRLLCVSGLAGKPARTRFANHPVEVLDLHLAGSRSPFQGIIGGDFLGHFDVLMDYAHRMLCLDDTKGDAGSRKRRAHRASETISDRQTKYP